MQEQFKPILTDVIARASDFQPQTNEILADLEEVKVLATNNLQAVMRRSDKLNDVEQEAKLLETHADEFRSSAADVKRKMMCRRLGAMSGIIITLLVVTLLITLPFWK